MSQSSSLWSDAIRRLFKNKAAVAGAVVLVVLIVLAIFLHGFNTVFNKSAPTAHRWLNA